MVWGGEIFFKRDFYFHGNSSCKVAGQAHPLALHGQNLKPGQWALVISQMQGGKRGEGRGGRRVFPELCTAAARTCVTRRNSGFTIAMFQDR